MKAIQTLPQDLSKLPTPVAEIIIGRHVIPVSKLALAGVTTALFIAVLCLMMDVAFPDVPMVAGSLATLLGGKPKRNFKIKASHASIAEERGERRPRADEEEEHRWEKYPRLMLSKELEVLS